MGPGRAVLVPNDLKEMGVSKNRGTRKSSILIGFSLMNHFGIPLFLETAK